jgi:RNA polymerase sigma factor (sigma-70 family)
MTALADTAPPALAALPTGTSMEDGSQRKISWSSFFDRERKRLVGYVRSRIDDAAAFDSEDIVQDIAAGLFDRNDLADTVDNIAAYVYQALRNRVVDYLRRRRRNEPLDAELPGDTGLALGDILADLNADTAGEVERREIRADLIRAVDMLDEKDQGIVIATEMQGRTFRDLSEETGLPVGTLLARKSRAMKKLRAALLDMDPDHYSRLQQKG